MTVQLLSDSPIFHGMALDLTDENIVPPGHISTQFTSYLKGTMHEMWMGDPHERRGAPMKALPAIGSMKAITAGPITQSLDTVRIVDSTVVMDAVPEGDIPTQTIKTVHVNLAARKRG